MYVSKKAQVLRSLLIVFLLTISANWNTSIASAQKSPSYSRDTILNELSEVYSTQEESQENISGGQAKDSSDSTQAENPSEYNILLILLTIRIEFSIKTTGIRMVFLHWQSRYSLL